MFFMLTFARNQRLLTLLNRLKAYKMSAKHLELRLWRVSRDLTCEALATHLGVSRRTLWTWETGRASIPSDLAARLSLVEAHLASEAVFAPARKIPVRKVRNWLRDQTFKRHATMKRWRRGFIATPYTEPLAAFRARLSLESVELFGVDIWELLNGQEP